MASSLLPAFPENNAKRSHNYCKDTKGATHIKLLQNEAEKIRIWNLQGDIKRQEMERAIKSLNITVESQRKSLLEVQMENEAISTKMHEEIGKRMSCLQKLDASRELCNLLKTQAYELNESIKVCKSYREMIGSENEQNKRTIDDLTNNFKNLAHSYDKRHNVQERKLHQNQENANKKTAIQLKEIQDLQVKLKQSDELQNQYSLESSVLAEKLAEQEAAMVKLNATHQKRISEYENQHKETLLQVEMLECDCRNKEKQMADMQVELKLVAESLEAQKKRSSLLEKQLEEEKDCSKKMQNSYDEKIADLDSKLSNKSEQINSQETSIQDLSTQLATLKKEKEASEKELKAKNKGLQQQHKTEMKELKMLNKKGNVEVLEQLSNKQAEMADMKSTYEKKIKDAQQQFKLEMKDLKSANKQDVASLTAQLQSTVVELKKGKDKTVEFKRLVEEKESELENAKQKLEQNEKSLEKLQEENSSLLSAKNTLLEEGVLLKEDKSELRKQFDAVTKDYNVAMSECKKLKEDIETHQKSISSLSTVKSELQKQIDSIISSSADVTNLENQISTLTKEIAALKVVQEGCEKDTEQLKLALKEKDNAISKLTEDLASKQGELTITKKTLYTTQSYYEEMVQIRKEQSEEMSRLEEQVETLKSLKSEQPKRKTSTPVGKAKSVVQEKEAVYKAVSKSINNEKSHSAKKQRVDYEDSENFFPSPTQCIKAIELGDIPEPTQSTPKRRYGRRERALMQMKVSKSSTPSSQKRKPLWKVTPRKSSGIAKENKQIDKSFNTWVDTDAIYGFFG